MYIGFPALEDALATSFAPFQSGETTYQRLDKQF
jgi:hypothetical protein